MGFIINPYTGAGGGPATDPDFAFVVSLLHFDGNLTDVIGPTWTPVNSITTSNLEAKFGGESLKVDAPGRYITTPDSAAWDLTGLFCIDQWVYPDTLTNLGGLIGNRDGAGDGWEIIVNNSGNGAIQFLGTSGVLTTANNVLTINTWSYIRVAGTSGSTVNLYVDGVCEATGTITIGAVANTLTIGARPLGTNSFGGYIDDSRITNGALRTTGSSVGTTYFTPPTAAHPDS